MSMTLLLSSALAAATANQADGIATELTTLLVNADSIDRVTAQGEQIAFSIASKGESYLVTATVHERTIVAVALTDLGAAPRAHEVGAFTWLAHELGRTEITALEVVADGAITVATTTGERFAMIRGTNGSAGAAARWAAAWE